MFKYIFVCLALVAQHTGATTPATSAKEQLCVVETQAGQWGYNARVNGVESADFEKVMKELEAKAKEDGVDEDVLKHALRGVRKAYQGYKAQEIYTDCMKEDI